MAAKATPALTFADCYAKNMVTFLLKMCMTVTVPADMNNEYDE